MFNKRFEDLSVLVVDDERIVGAGLRMLLRSEGIANENIDTAGSEEEAFVYLLKKDYDVLLLDTMNNMKAQPEPMGPNIARKLINQGKNYFIIALSGELENKEKYWNKLGVDGKDYYFFDKIQFVGDTFTNLVTEKLNIK